ncbi:MAG: hypothetical protein OHK0017_09340 [Patescibacteria group bacterium]
MAKYYGKISSMPVSFWKAKYVFKVMNGGSEKQTGTLTVSDSGKFEFESSHTGCEFVLIADPTEGGIPGSDRYISQRIALQSGGGDLSQQLTLTQKNQNSY